MNEEGNEVWKCSGYTGALAVDLEPFVCVRTEFCAAA